MLSDMDTSFQEVHALDEDVKILHSCDSCSYQSQYNQNLNRHKKAQHQLGDDHEVNHKTYVCDQCGKTYKTKYGLTLHIRSIHKGFSNFIARYVKGDLSQRTNYKHIIQVLKMRPT